MKHRMPSFRQPVLQIDHKVRPPVGWFAHQQGHPQRMRQWSAGTLLNPPAAARALWLQQPLHF